MLKAYLEANRLEEARHLLPARRPGAAERALVIYANQGQSDRWSWHHFKARIQEGRPGTRHESIYRCAAINSLQFTRGDAYL